MYLSPVLPVCSPAKSNRASSSTPAAQRPIAAPAPAGRELMLWFVCQRRRVSRACLVLQPLTSTSSHARPCTLASSSRLSTFPVVTGACQPLHRTTWNASQAMGIGIAYNSQHGSSHQSQPGCPLESSHRGSGPVHESESPARR